MAPVDMIYLDYNSTTPLAPEAAAAMAEWQTGRFGNPASQHAVGRRARQALEHAREEIGRILGASGSGHSPDRVILTSGGTEANNLFVFGMARLFDADCEPGEAIISAIEHPSITAPADVLAQRGWMIHRVGVAHEGVVDLAAFDELLSERTRFVSIMLANNETGVVEPVAEIARRCQALGVPMHTDAAQAVGKLPVDFRALGASAMTVAAHKFHGPLGVGALVARGDLDLRPLVVGGFQQDGMRGGTESVALAAGMHAALAAWEREKEARAERLRSLRDRLEALLVAGYPGRVVINGAAAPRLVHTSNVALVGADRQALVMALDLAGVACSTGSACASGSSEPSATLLAMGLDQEILAASVRFSLGAGTTAEEIDEAARRILAASAKVAGAGRRERAGVG
jgi:cysteine desulfurase